MGPIPPTSSYVILLGKDVDTSLPSDISVRDGCIKVVRGMLVQTHQSIDISSDSDQTIIDSPGEGKRIWITKLFLSSGLENPTNVEVVIKSGSTPVYTLKGASISLDLLEHLNLGEDEPFVIEAATSDRIVGGVSYYVEDV